VEATPRRTLAARRRRAVGDRWLEVPLVTAAVGTKLEGEEAERAEGGHEGDEREHVYMIGHMFPFL
jgi:hypothetical protein